MLFSTVTSRSECKYRGASGHNRSRVVWYDNVDEAVKNKRKQQTAAILSDHC